MTKESIGLSFLCLSWVLCGMTMGLLLRDALDLYRRKSKANPEPGQTWKRNTGPFDETYVKVLDVKEGYVLYERIGSTYPSSTTVSNFRYDYKIVKE